MNIPSEITQDCDTGINIASFSYYDGIREAEARKLKQVTSFTEIFEGPCFLVTCGDVCFRVTPEEYPELKRRIF